jgi:hypothetical protein
MGSDLGTKETRQAENPNAKDKSNDRDSGFALARPLLARVCRAFWLARPVPSEQFQLVEQDLDH